MPIEKRKPVRPFGPADCVVIWTVFPTRLRPPRPSPESAVTVDNPSSPGRGLRGLMPSTRIVSFQLFPPYRVLVDGIHAYAVHAPRGDLCSRSVTNRDSRAFRGSASGVAARDATHEEVQLLPTTWVARHPACSRVPTRTAMSKWSRLPQPFLIRSRRRRSDVQVVVDSVGIGSGTPTRRPRRRALVRHVRSSVPDRRA